MDSEVRETLKKAEKSLQGLLALPDKSGVDLQTKVHALSTWITHLQTVVETLQKAGTESERLEATTKKSMQETVQPIADDQRFIKEWTEAIDKELPKLQRLEDLSTQKSLDTLGEKVTELKTVLDTVGENTKEFSTQKSIDTLHSQAKDLKKALDTLGENAKGFSTQKSIDTLHDQAKELKKALENVQEQAKGLSTQKSSETSRGKIKDSFTSVQKEVSEGFTDTKDALTSINEKLATPADSATIGASVDTLKTLLTGISDHVNGEKGLEAIVKHIEDLADKLDTARRLDEGPTGFKSVSDAVASLKKSVDDLSGLAKGRHGLEEMYVTVNRLEEAIKLRTHSEETVRLAMNAQAATGAELGQMRLANDSLNQQLKAFREREQNLEAREQDIDSLNIDVATLGSENDGLKRRIDQLSKEIGSHDAELKAKAETQIKLNDQLNNLVDSFDTLCIRSTLVTEYRQARDAANAQLETDRTYWEGELRKERSLRDAAQTRAAQAESDKQSAVETAENKVSTLQSRLGPLEQFKQKAIEHAAAADAAAHERRQRIQQLEQEANGLQTRNGELTSTLIERETEIAKLRSIIGQATTERLTTNEELSRLQGVEISLRQEVSAHEGTISERNEQVKDLKTDKTNLFKYATELKSDKDTLTQANIKLKTDQDKLKGEVAGLKQQLTKSEGFAAQFKADKDRLEGDIKELKQQLAKSESLAAQLRQQLTESEKSAMQLKADKERLEGEVAGLKKKGSEMQTEIDNLQQETQERAARISTLEATTAKLEAEEKRTALLNELSAELRAAKAKLEGEAETRKQELAQLKQDKSALEGDAAAFAEEKKGLEREVEDLTADRDDLQDEVDAMQLEQTHESGQSPEELFNTLIATVEGVKSQVDLIARAHASQGDSAASDPRKRQGVSSDPEQLATDWTKASSKVSERLASFSIFDDGRHDNADEIVESLAFIAGDDEKWARFAQFVELAKHTRLTACTR
ncbi:hypothetical protein COL922a_002359 [Colletotrichum nupharicola]|nr:hypothetical protein COL922a_002359 [Colletotrichum nupharicola]